MRAAERKRYSSTTASSFAVTVMLGEASELLTIRY